MKLLGRCAIITGANQGFGLEVARHFVQEKAHVFLCARNAKLLAEAKRELETLAQGHTKVVTQVADVSNPQHMQTLAENALNELGHIDILVANAGVHGSKGPVEEIDWDEWSKAIDINLKGTVLQCRSVLPYFKKQKYGKIIILSGGGATKPMPNLSAYAASKAGVVRFAETLAEEVRDFHIDVNSVAPGALNTRLLEEILTAGPEKVGQAYYDQALKQKKSGGVPLETGAALCTFLASSESDGITGKLISAVWDPWKRLPALADQLRKTDIYTLRRIVPEDRGESW